MNFSYCETRNLVVREIRNCRNDENYPNVTTFREIEIKIREISLHDEIKKNFFRGITSCGPIIFLYPVHMVEKLIKRPICQDFKNTFITINLVLNFLANLDPPNLCTSAVDDKAERK